MVVVLHGDKRFTFQRKITGFEILKALGLREEEVLLVKDGKLLPMDLPVEEGEIRVIPVISGG